MVTQITLGRLTSRRFPGIVLVGARRSSIASAAEVVAVGSAAAVRRRRVFRRPAAVIAAAEPTPLWPTSSLFLKQLPVGKIPAAVQRSRSRPVVLTDASKFEHSVVR